MTFQKDNLDKLTKQDVVWVDWVSYPGFLAAACIEETVADLSEGLAGKPAVWIW